MSIKMKALRSITASQSPTGKQIKPGDPYEVRDEAAAQRDIARGKGEKAPTRAAKAE